MINEHLDIWDAMKETKYSHTLEELQETINDTKRDVNEAFVQTLDVVCRAIHAQTGTFWFYDKSGDGLIHPKAAFGGSEIKNLYLEPGQGIAGQVIASNRQIAIADCQLDDRWSGKVDKKTGFITRSMLCVPLNAHDDTFGCIQLINKADGTLFDRKDEDFAMQLAASISVAFEEHDLLSEFINKERIKQRKNVLGVKSGRTMPLAVISARVVGAREAMQRLESVDVEYIFDVCAKHISGKIMDYGGIVDRFKGDTINGLWIASDGGENPAVAANLAAREIIRHALIPLGKVNLKYGVKLDFVVGMDFGESFVCHIGSPENMELLSISSTVDNAISLCNYGERGKIYCSKRMGEAIGKAKSAKELPDATVKFGFEALRLN